MLESDPKEAPESGAAQNTPGGAMPVTRWTHVINATSSNEEEAREALRELYLAYRGPLFGLLRSKGISSEESEDLLQGFFTQLISKSGLRHAQKEKGRFRSFLRSSLIHYSIDQWRRRPRVDWELLDRDAGDREGPMELPSNRDRPDYAFDKSWAQNVLRRAMNRLEADYQSRGREAIFGRLHIYIPEKKPGVPLSESAGALGMTESAVKVEVHRMRKKFKEFIESEIADTLANPTHKAIEEEKQALFEALGRP